jgi:hypothetical protein
VKSGATDPISTFPLVRRMLMRHLLGAVFMVYSSDCMGHLSKGV